jgi:hypothetical protein
MILDHYLGVVTANDANTDQEKEFGIKCQVNGLLDGEEYPEIFYPIFPPNVAKVPYVGDIVEVLVPADEFEEPGVAELGVVSNPEFCYYTGKIFDLKSGKIPADLKQNYPKRSGIFWAKDGTIIYYDETDKKKELLITLTDKKVFVKLTENEILFQKNTTKVTLKDNQITAENGTAIIDLNGGSLAITNTTTALGTPTATQPILLGTVVTSAVSIFYNVWKGAIAVALQDPPAFVENKFKAYLQSLQPAVDTFLGTLTNWPSVKHKVDS